MRKTTGSVLTFLPLRVSEFALAGPASSFVSGCLGTGAPPHGASDVF